MKRELSAVVSWENDWFIAQCLEIDVASQGKTADEALENLRDALALHLTPPVATILPQVQRIQLDIAA